MTAHFDSGAFVRKSAWHQMGTVLPDYLSPMAMQTAAGLDWTVTKRPIFTTADGDVTNVIRIDDKAATVRSDTNQPLGVVGNTYEIIQNTAIFEFLTAVTDNGDVKIETAGALRGGRQVWAQARIGDTYSIGGDPHATYLTVATSHNGSVAFSIFPTNVRVVCANTFSMALAGKTVAYKVLHTVNHQANVADARRALDLTFRDSETFAAQVDRLQNETVTDAEFAALVERLTPMPADPTTRGEKTTATRMAAARDDLTGLWHGATIANIAGTKWAAINTINEWEQWKERGSVTAADRTIRQFLVGQAAGPLTNKAMALVGATLDG